MQKTGHYLVCGSEFICEMTVKLFCQNESDWKKVIILNFGLVKYFGIENGMDEINMRVLFEGWTVIRFLVMI